jgi:hypothetical protein
MLCISLYAEDVFYDVPLGKINVTKGTLVPAGEKDQPRKYWRDWWVLRHFMVPYTAANEDSEMYLFSQGRRRWGSRMRTQEIIDNTRILVRSRKGSTPSGILFLPNRDYSGMRPVEFSLDTPAQDQEKARIGFYKAKEQYYHRLLTMNIAGAAWFRHQKELARRAQTGAKTGTAPVPLPQTRAWTRRSEISQTLGLFSGGRAISENLQLERELRVTRKDEETIPVAELAGITVREYDWKQIIKDAAPEKDPLAQLIPHDQYALLFPSFASLIAMVDEAKKSGTPILRLVESLAQDAKTQQRYEQQLCLTMSIVARMLGPKLVQSVVITGSDPYLRTGTDVAIIFQTKNIDTLKTYILARQGEAKFKNKEVKSVAGTIEGVPYTGAVSSSRTICSYTAHIQDALIVTNSLIQIQQIARVKKGTVPSLASLDEYTFFRDRYSLKDKDETALLILTDAAIRKLCGPKWRIGASRRIRAAAVLSQLQAENLEKLHAGTIKPGPLATERKVEGLGTLSISEQGVSSSVYGNLVFLTPVAELDIEKVTKAEKDAYEWFRRGYQSRWRNYFDPIGVRFCVEPAGIKTDITVRPLIGGTEYRQFTQVCGNSTIGKGDGFPHKNSLVHHIMALDPESRIMKEFSNFASSMAPTLKVNVLGWLGKWITVYADIDPFWKELSNAMKEKGEWGAEEYFEKNAFRLPAAVHISVSNVIKLTGFLAAFRGFIEQTSPGMTAWESLKYKDRSYVKISPSAQAKAEIDEQGLKEIAVYYAPTPKELIITMNEDMLKRALDAVSRREKKDGKKKETDYVWPGKSMAVHMKQDGLELLKMLFRDNLTRVLRQRSWANIMILNEWKRAFKAEDPAAFHKKFWYTDLVCPGGGVYVWNEEFRTMESTVFGHPGNPRKVEKIENALFEITSGELGLTFEQDGIRAGATLKRKPGKE